MLLQLMDFHKVLLHLNGLFQRRNHTTKDTSEYDKVASGDALCWREKNGIIYSQKVILLQILTGDADFSTPVLANCCFLVTTQSELMAAKRRLFI